MGHNLQINWSNADKIIVKEHHIQCPPEDLNLIVTFVLVNSYDHRDIKHVIIFIGIREQTKW